MLFDSGYSMLIAEFIAKSISNERKVPPILQGCLRKLHQRNGIGHFFATKKTGKRDQRFPVSIQDEQKTHQTSRVTICNLSYHSAKELKGNIAPEGAWASTSRREKAHNNNLV